MRPASISDKTPFSLDLETTGLQPYRGDTIVSFALTNSAYTTYHDLRELSDESPMEIVLGILANPNNLVFIHNAKFDLHFVRQWAIKNSYDFRLNALILDTQVMARLVDNSKMRYSLNDVADWFHLAKDDRVAEWIKKNKAYRVISNEDTGDSEKVPDFTKVPREMLHEYCMTDASICFEIGMKLLTELDSLDSGYLSTLSVKKSVYDVLLIESECTKVLLGMESTGVLLNESLAQRALRSEFAHIKAARAEFEQLTGKPFVDSGKSLVEAFRAFPDDFTRIQFTEKGNPTFTDEILHTFNNPIAGIVKRHREASKKASSFYGNFIKLRGEDGRIHTNFRQAGTATGRLSCSDPNLQNISKGSDKGKQDDEKVRACFIPDPDSLWLSIDYQAQEYRMLLDLAGEIPVIEAIKGGLDVHTATAQMMGVSRQEAKTVNFLLLYGGGASKLASELNIPVSQAQDLRNLYFSRLPKVGAFVRAVIKKSEGGTISNWAGRVYKFDRNFAYKAPNYIIQGGCADVMKRALIGCNEFLKPYQTKMMLSVHDEICFNLHKNELDIIPELQRIMTEVYPSQYLPLETEASISDKSWAHVEKYVRAPRVET